MTPDVDAIRASLRIYQAVSRPVVRPDAVSPTPSMPTEQGARAGPRPIEGGAAGQASRGAPDPRTRDGPTDRPAVAEAMPLVVRSPDERELWVRDMKVRAEHASESPDGALPSLPTFEYSRGPDGRLYATGDPPQLHAPEDGELAQVLDEARGPEPPLPVELGAAPSEPKSEDVDPSPPDTSATRSTDRDPVAFRTRDGPEPSKVERAYVRAAQDEPAAMLDEVG